MRAITSLAAGLALASTASAHGGVLFYIIAGTYYRGFKPYNTPVGQVTIQREWDSYNPLLDPTQDDMRCNTDGAVANEVATVAAGSVVDAYWNNPWPHDIGPMVVWMANCGGDCSDFDGSGNVWFKIDQVGLVSGTLSGGVCKFYTLLLLSFCDPMDEQMNKMLILPVFCFAIHRGFRPDDQRQQLMDYYHPRQLGSRKLSHST